MKTNSPAEFTLTYLASVIGKQLSDNHFTIEAVHHTPSIFSRSTDEDIQQGFQDKLEKNNRANIKAVPKVSEKMGEVPKNPLDSSREKTFAFKISPKLLPVGTEYGVLVKDIENVEEYIVTSLLTGEISPDGMKFSGCGAVFNQETKKYNLFRKESEQTDRYFYTDPAQMQEVLYKTIAKAKAAGFLVDENKLSQELAKQASNLSKPYLEALTSLEAEPGKKIDPAKQAIISAGYRTNPKVACHINGKKLGSDRHNPIIMQYVDGVQEQSTGAAQVADAIRDNAELNSSLPAPVIKPIEEFLKNSKLKVGAKDFIIWAKDKGIQLPYQGKLVDPIFYAAQTGRLIDGQGSIEWAVRNAQTIEGLDAGLWAVKNDKTINGQDAIEWLAKNAVSVGEKAIPEETLFMAITKNKKIDGIEVFQWMAENNLMVKGKRDILPMDTLVWARIQHLKDPIKMPENPYDWAIKNDGITKIDGKDKFLFMIEDIHTLDKQNPIVWCINHKKPIDGKDALQWVKDNASHKAVQNFYEHLVMFSGKDVASIEGKDSVIWMIEQNLQPNGKDVIDYLKQYPDFTDNEHPVKWLKRTKNFDYVEYAFNEGLEIDQMHPVKWAEKNGFAINPEIECQYKAQQFQAEVEQVAGLDSSKQKAVIIQAAYAGKQDLLNALAGKKVDVYTPLAEEYVGLKNSAASKGDKRKPLETAYEGVLRAQGKNPLGKESSVGKLVFSNTIETLVRSFKHISSTSKNKLPMKGELTKGLQSEAILQKYTLPVVEKIHEIGQAIAKADREKPKGIKGTLQRCADWFSSIFAQNVKSEAIKAAKTELIGESPSVKAVKTKNHHAENVVKKRATTPPSGLGA